MTIEDGFYRGGYGDLYKVTKRRDGNVEVLKLVRHPAPTSLFTTWEIEREIERGWLKKERVEDLGSDRRTT